MGILYLKTEYNPKFVHDIKLVPGAKWNPKWKMWEVPDTPEHRMQVDRLMRRYFGRYVEDTWGPGRIWITRKMNICMREAYIEECEGWNESLWGR